MNNQELENLWTASDEAMERQININKPLLNEITMKKVKSNLVETRWDILLELVINIPFLGFFKNFCINHIYQPKFLLPGLFLLLLTALLVINSSY